VLEVVSSIFGYHNLRKFITKMEKLLEIGGGCLVVRSLMLFVLVYMTVDRKIWLRYALFLSAQI